MKPITRLGAFLAIILAIGACCTKKGCLGADTMDEIWLYGFENKEDLDTIVVKKYERGGDFNTLISIATTYFDAYQDNSDRQMVRLSERLTTDFDYRIELAGLVYEVSDFETKKRQCNTGFLCIDHYNALESYKVNGETIAGDWKVSLYK